MSERTRAWYRALLRILPQGFTRRFGRGLEEAFATRLAAARGRRLGRTRAWAAGLVDVLLSAPRLWLKALMHVSREPPSHPRIGMLAPISQDLRVAARTLWRSPVGSTIVVITLALAIGANTAVFSVVNGVLLRPLPYPDADRIYLIDAVWNASDEPHAPFPGGDVQFLEREATSFEAMAGMTAFRQNLLDTNGAEQIEVGLVTPGIFSVTGARPVLGRAFDWSDSPDQIVLSHAFWRSYFGEDPAVLGRTVNLDTHPVTIIGVLPDDFEPYLPEGYGWPQRVDAWRLPNFTTSNGDLWNATSLQAAGYRIIGRLRSGATLSEMTAELDNLALSRRETLTDHAAVEFGLAARPLHSAVVGDVRAVLLLLFGAVALVLLIACVNVANIMLVRAQGRRREMAVRVALGGGRQRIVSLILTESALLALVGAAGGVLLALGGVRALMAVAPAGLQRLGEVGLDGTLLLFVGGVTVLCTLLFGLAPALLASRTPPGAALQASSRGASECVRQRTHWLVGAEVALSVVLLIGAGLLLRTFSTLQDVRPGFDYDRLLTFSVSVPGTKYDFPEGTARFYNQLLSSSVEVPGVRSAAVVWPIPLEGQTWSGLYSAGAIELEEQRTSNYRVISAGYFETVGATLTEGRTFGAQDPRNVAVVSRSLVERAWPGESGVGRRVFATPWGGPPVEFEVIGVAEDIRYGDIREDPSATIYFSLEGWSWADWEFGAVARTDGPPLAAVPGVRLALAGVDPDVPLARPRAMRGYVQDLISPNRFALTLFGTFAGLAALLSVIGIYGVMSNTVSQRTRELGIRLAMGADPMGLVKLVLAQSAAVVVPGVVVGILAAAWLARFVEGLLFGVMPTDPTTYTAIVTLVLVSTAAASLIPARRAATVDPVEALREE